MHYILFFQQGTFLTGLSDTPGVDARLIDALKLSGVETLPAPNIPIALAGEFSKHAGLGDVVLVDGVPYAAYAIQDGLLTVADRSIDLTDPGWPDALPGT